MQAVYILSAVRTPIGKFGGSLASQTAADMTSRSTLRLATFGVRVCTVLSCNNAITPPGGHLWPPSGLGFFGIAFFCVSGCATSGQRQKALNVHVAFRKWHYKTTGQVPCLERVPKEDAGFRWSEFCRFFGNCRLGVRLLTLTCVHGPNSHHG